MYSENTIPKHTRRATPSVAAFATIAAAAVAVTTAGIALFPHAAAQTPTPPLPAAPPITPVPLALPTQPPRGATVLLGGTGATATKRLRENWYRRYTTQPGDWAIAPDGTCTPQKSDLTSRQEFGDCYLHAEFRTPAPAPGKPGTDGNSGIGFQGRYEVQILGDYGTTPKKHGSAALYSQTASAINASKPAGEWQTYDILFRAPRFDAEGKVSENPRVTVFHNGIPVQNNAAFTGMTGIQYGEYKEMTKTGPLVLQGDHDAVQYRNLWIIPLTTMP